MRRKALRFSALLHYVPQMSLFGVVANSITSFTHEPTIECASLAVKYPWINSVIIRSLIVSLLGLFATLLIGMLASTLIPRSIDLDTGREPTTENRRPPKSYYTLEEMDQIERESQEKLKRFEEKEKLKPMEVKLLESRSVGIPYTWIPWLFVPWLAGIRKSWYPKLLFVLVVPVIAMSIGVIYPIEALWSLIASLFGFWVLNIFISRRRLLPEDVD